jgi:23S rRNA pseudouridine1911/1915/1917 synthase
MEPSILHEDEQLIAVAKPAGLVVHADGRTVEPTLTDWVLARYPGLKDVGGLHTLDNERYAPRAGILHRLDRETSGVILIAKDDETFYFLQRQFLEHSIQKTYLAYIEGKLLQSEGTIDAPIGRSRSDFRKWATGSDARGTLRKSVTHFRELKTNGTYSLVELTPETGRTHQLRVHMHSLGHPIVADSRYGTRKALGFDRVALHAGTILFAHPNGKKMTISAPLPTDFVAAEKEI